MLITMVWYAVSATLLSTVIFLARERRRYPPGPKGLPVVGNIFDVPKRKPWKIYAEWGRRCGSEFVHFKLFNTHVIVVNTERVAKDLMEKRAANYSGRPMTVMIHELTGWGRNLGFMDYGDSWRAHRRMFHQQFTPKALPRYHSLVQQEVLSLLRALKDSPNQFAHHIRYMKGSMILKLVYDIDAQRQDDPYVIIMEKALDVIALIGNAGSYLVDSLPILKNVPLWFPGATFKRQAAEWKPLVDTAFLKPFYDLKSTLDAGQVRPCVASEILARYSLEEYNEELEQTIINTTGTTYAGAVETTSTTLQTFFLTMLQNPDVQHRAQEELDQIIGRTRLPQLEDRDSLPYITALAMEVLRWHPALPLGVAHRSIHEDVYEGFYIPANTIIIPNAWAMFHNQERYPDPFVFDPSRFLGTDGQLDPDVPSPLELFGFGRRICPGRHLAQDIVWMTVANVLAAFTIDKPRGEDGHIIEPSGEYADGFTSPPKSFKADIKLRFAEVTKLIKKSGLEVDE